VTDSPVVATAAGRIAGAVRSARLALHAAGLLFVLLVLLPIVGTAASYSADEGAAIIQAQSLADGDGWIIPHPLPEVDPDGELYPLELSSVGPEGTAAYAKHPLFPVLLAAMDRLGGHTAMVLLSLVGTWAAALGAAILSRQLFDGYERSSLWLAGMGSPLLFHAYWVTAHSIAAAAVVWAVVTLVRSAGPARWPWSAAGSILLAAAALLRTEGLIAAAAVTLACIATALLRRRLGLALTGGLVGAMAWGADRLDDWWLDSIVGGPASSTPGFAPRSRSGGWEDRVDAFVTTWLRPSPAGEEALASALVFAAVVVLLGAAVALRRGEGRAATALAVSGAGLLVVRAVGLPAAPVPGLVMSFPLLAVAVIAVGPEHFERWTTRLVLAVVGLMWAGVLVTQYAEGGVAEWGGRYFALGVPLIVPVVVVVVVRLTGRLAGAERRALAGALVVATLALSWLSVRELRAVHTHTERVLDSIASLSAEAGRTTVIVTDAPPLPRLDWKRFEEHRWLLVDPLEHPDLPRRLADVGLDSWVLVTADPERALDAFSGLRVVGRATPDVLLVTFDGA